MKDLSFNCNESIMLLFYILDSWNDHLDVTKDDVTEQSWWRHKDESRDFFAVPSWKTTQTPVVGYLMWLFINWTILTYRKDIEYNYPRPSTMSELQLFSMEFPYYDHETFTPHCFFSGGGRHCLSWRSMTRDFDLWPALKPHAMFSIATCSRCPAVQPANVRGDYLQSSLTCNHFHI